MGSEERKKTKNLKIITLLISGLMTVLNLGQWFLVSIIGWTEAYSFGKKDAKPYFYKSADLFALVNLYWGLLFLAFFVLSLLAVFSKNKKLIISALTLNLLLVAGYIYHGSMVVN